MSKTIKTVTVQTIGRNSSSEKTTVKESTTLGNIAKGAVIVAGAAIVISALTRR